MAFRITTKILLNLLVKVPAKEQFERVRCTVFGLRLGFYSFSKEIRLRQNFFEIPWT
jgi:hypothetical protein